MTDTQQREVELVANTRPPPTRPRLPRSKMKCSQLGSYTVIKDNLQAKEVIIGDGERCRSTSSIYNPD
jgi:hypothetical protein